jgi:hypothetical protein
MSSTRDQFILNKEASKSLKWVYETTQFMKEATEKTVDDRDPLL